jgi:hypothetical protein
MKANFYVLDGEGNTLYHGRDTDDCPQPFATFKAAEKRAKSAANTEPGTEFRVVQVVAVVACPVAPAKTKRV